LDFTDYNTSSSRDWKRNNVKYGCIVSILYVKEVSKNFKSISGCYNIKLILKSRFILGRYEEKLNLSSMCRRCLNVFVGFVVNVGEYKEVKQGDHWQ
jgi:hypothetical protein